MLPIIPSNPLERFDMEKRLIMTSHVQNNRNVSIFFVTTKNVLKKISVESDNCW